MFLGILGPPYCGIGATIRIGREMLCLPYAGFFLHEIGMIEVNLTSVKKSCQVAHTYDYLPTFPPHVFTMLID